MYYGIFLTKKSTQTILSKEANHLAKTIENMHVTLAYNPTDKHCLDYLLGKKISIIVNSYGCSNDNSGFKVFLPKDIPCQNVNPHVTVSISECGKAVTTNQLDFKPCEKFVIEGIIGRFEKGVVYFK